jgi:S-adenosylmethionine decarboxylase
VDLTGGCEWVVEALGCPASFLTDKARLAALFDDIIADLELHPIGEAAWHQFPEPGGITGVALLRESHLACHTFPEFGSMCLNLFCCRPRASWNFEGELARRLGASEVKVRLIDRPYHS